MEEEIIDTSGFYINDEGVLRHAPNFVLGQYQRFELRRETKDSNTYPVEGWHWFDSEKEAKRFFNLD